MVPLGFRVVDAVNELEISIGNDLSDALDTPVLVKFFRNHVPHAWDDLKTIPPLRVYKQVTAILLLGILSSNLLKIHSHISS